MPFPPSKKDLVVRNRTEDVMIDLFAVARPVHRKVVVNLVHLELLEFAIEELQLDLARFARDVLGHKDVIFEEGRKLGHSGQGCDQPAVSNSFLTNICG